MPVVVIGVGDALAASVGVRGRLAKAVVGPALLPVRWVRDRRHVADCVVGDGRRASERVDQDEAVVVARKLRGVATRICRASEVSCPVEPARHGSSLRIRYADEISAIVIPVDGVVALSVLKASDLPVLGEELACGRGGGDARGFDGRRDRGKVVVAKLNAAVGTRCMVSLLRDGANAPSGVVANASLLAGGSLNQKEASLPQRVIRVWAPFNVRQTLIFIGGGSPVAVGDLGKETGHVVRPGPRHVCVPGVSPIAIGEPCDQAIAVIRNVQPLAC